MDSSQEYVYAFAQPGEAQLMIEAASEVMQIRSAKWKKEGLTNVVGRSVPPGDPALELRGRLLVDSDRAYGQLSERFKSLGYVLLLRKDGDDQVCLLYTSPSPRDRTRSRMPS